MPVARAQIEADQLHQLNRLIKALVPGNRFYASRLEQAGIAGGVESLTEFARRLPATTKQELVADQQQHAPFGSNLTFPLNRYTRCHQTSATTGIPIRWLDTPDDWDWLTKTWTEVYRAAGVTAADRVYFAFSFGPFIGFWMAFDAAQRFGCLCVPGGGLGSVARLRAILENEVTVLCCTPTYALRLGEVAAEEGIDLGKSKVRVIIVAGEPGGSIPATRQAIMQAWPGAHPFDHHGMTEVGPVTYEWPGNPGALAVIESAFIAEIVDPVTGHEVEPGQTGELILTNLGRVGSPVLRYRSGDLVKKTYRVGDDGQARLVLDGGILSRVDDMIIVRGTNLYPVAVETVIRQFPDVAEYRAEIWNQHAMTELSIVIEPVPGCSDVNGLAAGVGKALQTAFLVRIPVTVTPAGSLPRFEMKARRWVRA